MSRRLEGRSYIVSGSSSGVGEGIARMIASDGGAVLIHGLEVDRVQHVTQEILDSGGTATGFAGDLVDPKTPSQMVDCALETFGKLDGIVNNAGISTRCDIESTTPELFDHIMAINARAPMLLVQAALPALRRSNCAAILNIGSVNAYSGWSRLLPYSMSKGALMTMTRNLSSSLAKDRIRVNQLNIGWTLTENEAALQREDGQPEDWLERIPRDRVPFGRMLSPEDVARMACFLLSRDAELVNGSVIDYNQHSPF